MVFNYIALSGKEREGEGKRGREREEERERKGEGGRGRDALRHTQKEGAKEKKGERLQQ